MAETTESIAAEKMTSAPTKSIGQKALSGFIWLTIQVIAVKAVNFLGQIILARLLSAADYGLVGLAYSVSSFPNLLQRAGTREVLIHRSNRFSSWANAAFWMSTVLGIVSAIAHIILAPIAVWYYKEPALGGLLIVLGLVNILNPLSIVPEAKLQIDLRFRFVAIFGVIANLASTIITIGLAYTGFHAYSFLWPMVVIGAIRAVVYYLITKPNLKLKWRLDFYRWRAMYIDSGMVLMSWVCMLLIQNGDYLVLGMFHGAAITGIYFWAYNLSLQTYQLLALNLTNVLFPALQKMQDDPARMSNAFTKACRVLMVFGVPVCMLQLLLAQPIVHFLFKPTWYAGIPAIQILSIGMAFQLLLQPAISFLQAQGRFKDATIISVGLATLFLILVFFAAKLATHDNAVTFVSVAVSLFFMIGGPLATFLAYPKPDRQIRQVYLIVFLPIAATSAFGIIWFICSITIYKSFQDLHLILASTIYIFSYAIFIIATNGIYRDRLIAFIRR